MKITGETKDKRYIQIPWKHDSLQIEDREKTNSRFEMRLDLKAVQAHGLWKTGEAEIYIFILSTSKGE